MVYHIIESIFREISPQFLQDHLQITVFLGLLSYLLFFYNWVIHTNMEEKFNLVSLITATFGLLHLHYTNVTLLFHYEAIFVTTWLILLLHHLLTWHSNYRKVMRGTAKSLVRRRETFIARFFITVPEYQNALGHWNDPPFKNSIHVLLMFLYASLLLLHAVPFVFGTTHPPFHYLSSPPPPPPTSPYSSSLSSPGGGGGAAASADDGLCHRYNYVMSGFHTHILSRSFCSAHVNIAFAGSWSTGKTYLINSILGHEYATAQSAPAPTTDKFTCVTMGSPYRDVVRSGDWERRQHCEIMSHVGDVVGRSCGEEGQGEGMAAKAGLLNVLDVADDNEEFGGYVFFDMPGYQREYGEDCRYRNFYRQLIDKVDYTFVVWDVSHGKIEEEFAEFFQSKSRGTNYEIIYNRYDETRTDMSFLNQQYAKMSGTGQEMLSEMYVTKVHENIEEGIMDEIVHRTHSNSRSVGETMTGTTTATAVAVSPFKKDIRTLRSKIKSVSQTVRDNRKKLMKANLVEHEEKLTGFFSLYRLKMSRRLIEEDLNLHVRPKGRLW